MNKKIIMTIIIAGLVILGAVSLVVFLKPKPANNQSQDDTLADQSNLVQDNSTKDDKVKGVAIVYFSATGTTEKVAEAIHSATGGDLLQIIPTTPYSAADLDYGSDCRANREQNDNSARPAIQGKINLDSYDTIFLGYPIWWGDVPKIILTLLESKNLEGKTIIPFATSHSSGMDGSVQTVKQHTKANILEGRRFGATSSNTEIQEWAKRALDSA